jgi:beta-glucanase (GH16 family)
MWWYDSNMVEVDALDILHLKTGPSLKTFPELNIQSYIGAGLVSCTKKFTYGTFSITAKLPRGKNLWPAFWMYSWDSWPPEIDIIEGFSDNSDDYKSKDQPGLWSRLFRKLVRYEVHPNVHFMKNDHQNINDRYKIKYITNRQFVDKITDYKCIWTPTELVFYYDDTLVLSLQSNNTQYEYDVLETLKNVKMNVILNNGVTAYANWISPVTSDFKVYNFTYTPL